MHGARCARAIVVGKGRVDLSEPSGAVPRDVEQERRPRALADLALSGPVRWPATCRAVVTVLPASAATVPLSSDAGHDLEAEAAPLTLGARRGFVIALLAVAPAAARKPQHYLTPTVTVLAGRNRTASERDRAFGLRRKPCGNLEPPSARHGLCGVTFLERPQFSRHCSIGVQGRPERLPEGFSVRVEVHRVGVIPDYSGLGILHGYSPPQNTRPGGHAPAPIATSMQSLTISASTTV